METETPLGRAIAAIGLCELARHLKVTHQAVRLWEKRGRLPRTEWTGETQYGHIIERLTQGAVTKAELLAPRGRRTNSTAPASPDGRRGSEISAEPAKKTS